MAPIGALQLLWITIPVWLIFMFIALSYVRKSRKSIENVTNEVPKLIIMAFSSASIVTLAITVAISIVSSQLLQDPSAALYTTSLVGAAISLWWTIAVFWREIKLVSGKLSPSPSTREQPEQTPISVTAPLKILVQLPLEGWGAPKSPVEMVVTGGTLVGELISKIDGEYHLPPKRIWYVNTGLRFIGPDHYRGTLEAVGIQNGQKIEITDTPPLTILGYRRVNSGVTEIQQTIRPMSRGNMRVRIGTLEIREPDITRVSRMGMGFSGFEFQGLAPDERGKHIVNQLKEIMQAQLVIECEAVPYEGKPMLGHGKLENVKSQVLQETPILYRFSGSVRLME